MITKYYLNILIILFLFLIIFGLAEFLYKKKIKSYLTRKIVHIGGAFVIALFPFFINLKTTIIIGISFFFILLFSKYKKLLNSIHDIDSYSTGALLFAPTMVLVAFIFWPINIVIFQGSVLILGFSDGLAGLIGKKYGKINYSITGPKTIEGSLTFFLITFFLLICIFHINGNIVFNNIFSIFEASLLLTIVEAVFSNGWDNFFVPIISGIILYFIL